METWKRATEIFKAHSGLIALLLLATAIFFALQRNGVCLPVASNVKADPVIGSPNTIGQLWPLLLGALLAYLSSIAMWRTQKKDEKRRLAVGFLIEVEQLDKSFRSLHTTLKNATNPPANYNGPRGLVRLDSPFYKNGLFHTCQKEVLAYDDELSAALLRFYVQVSELDNVREGAAAACTKFDADKENKTLQQAAIGMQALLSHVLGDYSKNPNPVIPLLRKVTSGDKLQ